MGSSVVGGSLRCCWLGPQHPLHWHLWLPCSLTKALAMDCEMVGVGPKGEESVAARVSIVNQYGKCVYDKFVKPSQPVTDYRTAVSGVRPELLKKGGSLTASGCEGQAGRVSAPWSPSCRGAWLPRVLAVLHPPGGWFQLAAMPTVSSPLCLSASRPVTGRRSRLAPYHLVE